jgi:hypothetical protein
MRKDKQAKREEEGSVKMIFSRDMFYTDLEVPLYSAGKVYDVDLKMRDRWIKRGGQIVSDLSKVEYRQKETLKHQEVPKEPVEQKEEKQEDESSLDLQPKTARSVFRK